MLKSHSHVEKDNTKVPPLESKGLFHIVPHDCTEKLHLRAVGLERSVPIFFCFLIVLFFLSVPILSFILYLATAKQFALQTLTMQEG